MNVLSNLDETYQKYSLALNDDLVRFWRSKVKVTAAVEELKTSTSTLVHLLVCSTDLRCIYDVGFLSCLLFSMVESCWICGKQMCLTQCHLLTYLLVRCVSDWCAAACVVRATQLVCADRWSAAEVALGKGQSTAHSAFSQSAGGAVTANSLFGSH